jgi:uncharacterized membrane protein
VEKAQMKGSPDNGSGSLLSSHRLDALTDGVFAIAMTILVLNIDLPPLGRHVQPAQLLSALIKIWPQIATYGLSFLILGSLWIGHTHRFRWLKQTERRHLWLNIVGLMLVCLVPFSTSLINDYGGLMVAEIFFHLNMFAVGAIFYLQWNYAIRDKRLMSREIDPSFVRVEKRANLVLPTIAVFCLILALWIPDWSVWPYLATPFIVSRIRRRG